MHINSAIFAAYIIIGEILPAIHSAVLQTCNGNDLEKCALSAESLLKDPSLVFPDSPASLDRVCRTWNNFTACIADYTKNCFTHAEKSRFDEEFKEPSISMNTLCQDQAYRKEYFKVAPCIQKMTTNEAFCGFQYRFLIDQISGSIVTMKQLCCAREKFRQCILLKTESVCAGEDKFFGRQRPGEINSTTFAIQVLDKSLAFIAQQCSLPSIKNDDCPGSSEIDTTPFYNKGHRVDRIPTNDKDIGTSNTNSSSRYKPSSPVGGSPVTPNFQTGNIYNRSRTANPSPSNPTDIRDSKPDASNSASKLSSSSSENSVNSKLNTEIMKSASSGPFSNKQQQNTTGNNNRIQNDAPEQGHLSSSTSRDEFGNEKNKNSADFRDYSRKLVIACVIISLIPMYYFEM